MKILQKITWILFLIIGFLSSNNCRGTVDYVSTTHFRYVNQTSENVELNLFNNQNVNFRNYTIPVGQTVSIDLKQEGEKGVGTPFGFEDNYAEKVIIKFVESEKCLVNYPKIRDSRKYDNYNVDMLNQSDNTLIHYIDNEELELATNCQ